MLLPVPQAGARHHAQQYTITRIQQHSSTAAKQRSSTAAQQCAALRQSTCDLIGNAFMHTIICLLTPLQLSCHTSALQCADLLAVHVGPGKGLCCNSELFQRAANWKAAMHCCSKLTLTQCCVLICMSNHPTRFHEAGLLTNAHLRQVSWCHADGFSPDWQRL